MTDTINRLTSPNVINDDQSRANRTQQPRQECVPNENNVRVPVQTRQERGSNVNNVRVQTEPEAGGSSPPCQRCQSNENNVRIQFDPEGRDIIYDSDEDLNSDEETTSNVDTLSVCLRTIALSSLLL